MAVLFLKRLCGISPTSRQKGKCVGLPDSPLGLLAFMLHDARMDQGQSKALNEIIPKVLHIMATSARINKPLNGLITCWLFWYLSTYMEWSYNAYSMRSDCKSLVPVPPSTSQRFGLT